MDLHSRTLREKIIMISVYQFYRGSLRIIAVTIFTVGMVSAAFLYLRGFIGQKTLQNDFAHNTPAKDGLLPWVADSILERPVVRLDDEFPATYFGTVGLISPKEGEIFFSNRKNIISWENTIESGVDISLHPAYPAEDPLGIIAVNQKEGMYLWDGKTICKNTGKRHVISSECFEIPTGFYKIHINGHDFFAQSRRFIIASEDRITPSIEFRGDGKEMTVHSGAELMFMWNINSLPTDFENWKVRILMSKQEKADETEILSLPLAKRTNAFFWKVPFFSSYLYRIIFKGCLSRIASSEEYCDAQQSFYIIPPEKENWFFGPPITRISPNGGDVIIQGQKIKIRWSGGRCEACIQIILRSSDSLQYISHSRQVGWIAWDQHQDGEFLWDGKTICSYSDPGWPDYACSAIPPGYYALEIRDNDVGLSGHPFTILPRVSEPDDEMTDFAINPPPKEKDNEDLLINPFNSKSINPLNPFE